MNREELQLKLSKIGYEHPSQNNHILSPYKVYNTENQNTETYSSNSYDIYSKFNSTDTVSSCNICPVCDNKAIYICECDGFKDRMCKKGHIWYNKGKNVIIGNPHENEQ